MHPLVLFLPLLLLLCPDPGESDAVVSSSRKTFLPLSFFCCLVCLQKKKFFFLPRHKKKPCQEQKENQKKMLARMTNLVKGGGGRQQLDQEKIQSPVEDNQSPVPLGCEDVITMWQPETRLDEKINDGFTGTMRERILSWCQDPDDWMKLFVPSTVSNTVGEPIVVPWRTSSSMLVPAANHLPILERVINLQTIKEARVERMEIVRYMPGEKWDAHMSCDSLTPARDSRCFGVHIFLNTIPEGAGGELSFPGLGGVQFAPRAGHAIWWRPTTKDNSASPDSLVCEHPTVPGTPAKFVLMIWIRR